MTPWYLKILQELCDHKGATIQVVHSCVTLETIIVKCKPCGKILCSVTEC